MLTSKVGLCSSRERVGHFLAFLKIKLLSAKSLPPNRPCSRFFVHSKWRKEPKKPGLVGVHLKNFTFVPIHLFDHFRIKLLIQERAVADLWDLRRTSKRGLDRPINRTHQSASCALGSRDRSQRRRCPAARATVNFSGFAVRRAPASRPGARAACSASRATRQHLPPPLAWTSARSDWRSRVCSLRRWNFFLYQMSNLSNVLISIGGEGCPINNFLFFWNIQKWKIWLDK